MSSEVHYFSIINKWQHFIADMASEFCLSITKYFLFLFNLIFFVSCSWIITIYLYDVAKSFKQTPYLKYENKHELCFTCLIFVIIILWLSGGGLNVFYMSAISPKFAMDFSDKCRCRKNCSILHRNMGIFEKGPSSTVWKCFWGWILVGTLK